MALGGSSRAGGDRGDVPPRTSTSSFPPGGPLARPPEGTAGSDAGTCPRLFVHSRDPRSLLFPKTLYLKSIKIVEITRKNQICALILFPENEKKKKGKKKEKKVKELGKMQKMFLKTPENAEKGKKKRPQL